MSRQGEAKRPRIVVAGGGCAALEAILTIRERLGERPADLCLIAPNRTFRFRPLSAVAEFATHPPHELPLDEVAASLGARLVHDRVALVDETRMAVLTHDGDWVGFDRLLLAVGVRSAAVPAPLLAWPAEGDPSLLRDLVDRAVRGEVGSVGVAVPATSGWPIAAYELALILAHAARAQGAAVRVTLLTEERRPLAAFGATAGEIVDGELERAGVEVVGGVRVRERELERPAPRAPHRRPPAGARAARGEAEPVEVVADGRRMRFDAVIALPAGIGPDIGGVADDARGYIEVDEHGLTIGSESVWAAGDCTRLPLKHSTLAVAQADAAADSLAAACGAAVEPAPFEPVLRGIIVSGAAERWWSENAAGTAAAPEAATHCLWWPPGKVVGARLAHYLAHRDQSARPFLLAHPSGTAIAVALRVPPPEDDPEPPSTPAAAETEARAHEVDAIDRRILAMQRLEREAEATLERLERHLAAENEHSREVLGHLNRAGYLLKDEEPAGEG